MRIIEGYIDVLADKRQTNPSQRLHPLWRELSELIWPRRRLLSSGMLLVLINRLSGLAIPYLNRFLIDDVIGRRQLQLLTWLLITAMIAIIVQGISSFALTKLFATASQALIAELRQKVQEHIGRLRITYYDANKCGALVSRILWDVQGVRNFVGLGLLDFAGGLMTSIIASIVLLRISPVLTLLTALSLTLHCYKMRRNATTIRRIFRENDQIHAEVTGRLIETISGARVVKGYHAEAREAEIFAGGIKLVFENARRSIKLIAQMSFFTTLLTGIVGALVMFVGGRQVLTGTLTLGEFVTFMVFLAVLISPVSQLVNIGPQLSEAVAGLERTREVLREQPEDRDPRRTVTLGQLHGEVLFDNVRFSYETGNQVLVDVSFRAEPGTVTALVGPSGAGKSTIISLVAGFYVASEGQVCVDGHDLSTARLDTYRTQLGLVFQDPFLFDGTIGENIAFAKPGATKEQIVTASRLACVDEFAERLENGYDTVVGERGIRLSGGQRQRVSIARAILANPRILILDEATSSLDVESEALIQEALKHLMKGRTTIVIAHRLSTIRHADQILFLEKGRIVERGEHNSLYALGGRYWDLYSRQYGTKASPFPPAHGGQG